MKKADDQNHKSSGLAGLLNCPCSGDCAPGQCLGMQIGLEPGKAVDWELESASTGFG